MHMKKSKRQANDFHIKMIYNPYCKSSDDTFDDIYQRYLDDDSRIIKIDGLIYYKAAQISKLTIHSEYSLEIVLP